MPGGIPGGAPPGGIPLGCCGAEDAMPVGCIAFDDGPPTPDTGPDRPRGAPSPRPADRATPGPAAA